MDNKNNAKNKLGIFIRSGDVTNNSVEITVKVMKGDTPQSNVEVQLYKDGQLMPGFNGKTGSDGTFSREISIPSGAKTFKVKAQIPNSGVFSAETSISVDAAVTGQNRGDLPVLVVEDIILRPDKYRLMMAIFDGKGKMLAGNLQFSADKDLVITFPYTKQDEESPVLQPAPDKINGQMFEFDLDGYRWLAVDIEFKDKFELDIYVAGWQKKTELKFAKPKVASVGEPIPFSRPLFAALCIMLFFTALFTNSWFGLWLSALIAVIPTFIFLIIALNGAKNHNNDLRKEPKLKPIERLSTAVIRTNNRWLFTLMLLTGLTFMLFLVAPWGPPELTKDRRDKLTMQQRQNEYKPGDRAQIRRNSRKNLSAKTDRDLTTLETENTWESFKVRWTIFIILLILTIVYIPIALTDEASSAFYSLWGKINKKTEGTAGKGRIQSWIDMFRGDKEVPAVVIQEVTGQPVDPNAPPPTPAPAPGVAQVSAPGSSIWSQISMAVLIQTVSEFAQEFIENRRKKNRNSRGD